ncbi:Hypothetical predicted protein [Octopus vulgaris]|uniref:Uncharacterized protein n=1 Tax=Octopus vulgaris TaxID=6645 RepID=A0AA36B602_OCTVU|nr:Hypothetical predicted protein [Octopus vulgaris]
MFSTYSNSSILQKPSKTVLLGFTDVVVPPSLRTIIQGKHLLYSDFKRLISQERCTLSTVSTEDLQKRPIPYAFGYLKKVNMQYLLRSFVEAEKPY